jgi:hypothetical protein
MRLLLSVVLFASAWFFGIFGFAAAGDAWYVCPNGNQCSDAIVTFLFSGTIVFALLTASFLLMRSHLIKRKSDTSET